MRLNPLFALTLLTTPLFAQKEPAPKEIPTISTRTATMTAMPGLLPLFWDTAAGKLYLEIPAFNQDILYTHSLPHGTGSNDLGLDRGQISEGVIVHFERFGPKVLLVQPNEAFRSTATDPAERLSIHQSFPESVLAGFKVEAADPSGSVLVDATDFFLRDAHGVAETLTGMEQGAYHLDKDRSAIAVDHTKAFPKNTEVEALLTFVTDARPKGEYVRDVTPDPHALTVREHQSFIELPGPGFTPRRFDPRAGYFPVTYRDYSAPLGEPLDQQFIIRHRLIQKDPACTHACQAVTPIQYYVDRGAPEPIRSALLEGARWWDQAFQAAGWAKGTFRVDILPADADPMDIRYNIIQWVHRYTRGWSYGAAVTDPRTGEIIKGNVTLGSLRGRQDYLIAEALLSPYTSEASHNGPGAPSQTASSSEVGSNEANAPHPKALSSRPKRSEAEGPASPEAEQDPMLQMVLARIRQLAAHETGHTLGLSHNFAASAFSQSASVMDYPHPYVTLTNHGVPDLSHAYAVNIGQWDKVAIDYGYRQFPNHSDEHTELNKILAASEKTGLQYITDEDARPFSGAHPHAHLWDNGSDPADELNRVLDIRAVALKRFGENAIKPGIPLAQLEDTLVPLYLFHRYQTEATIKEIGGLDYRYSLRGDGQPLPEIVSPADQQEALTAVLKTLSPETLTLPESLLKILPPLPPGSSRTRESFPSETGLTFDPVATAESAADLTLTVLFNPARASRLVQYHMREPAAPSLRSILEAVSTETARRPDGGHSLSSEVARAVEFRAVEAMLTLAVNSAASTQARAITRSHLDDLQKSWTTGVPPTDTAEAIHRTALLNRLTEFTHDPTKFIPAKPLPTPPGMPIGDDNDD